MILIKVRGVSMEEKEAKSIIESLLFVWSEPLKIKEISKVLEIPQADANRLLLELKEDLLKENRGIQLIEIKDAFQLCTKYENHPFIEKLCMTSQNRGLSQPTLEVLAIIAYKQSITKHEIDFIRGVKSDKAINNLIERELVEIKGRLEKTGRPIIYGTTDVFLKCFGFKTIDELPPMSEFGKINFLNDYLNMDEGY